MTDTPTPTPTASAPSGLVTTLPAALMQQSARRLRVMALLYAAVFFLAGTAPVLLLPDERAAFLGSPTRWLPSLLSIGSALLVAFLASRPQLSSETDRPARTGLPGRRQHRHCMRRVPPAADGHDRDVAADGALVGRGLDAVVHDHRAQPAVIGARGLAGLGQRRCRSSAGIATRLGYLPAVPPLEFFLHAVLPYLIVVVIAGVAAKLVYSLGIDLKRALDLGSYQLEERLGSGGMGEVWRARHRLLARPAAVKLIRPEVFQAAGAAKQSALRRRFEREAQTTSLLQSPHTIDLFDFGVTDDGAFYYVMELLDGFDLKTLVERFGPLPVERAVHLLVQVCHSLAEAHASGLVHRDIKPANIFVCRYGRDVDFVKVLDFGLVKPEADGAQNRIHGVTHADRIGGTPAFMSPEQALGQRQIDGRADIYALGCVAYWLVTGSLVFPRNSAMAMAVAHSQAEPEPPSHRTELPVPASFDALVLECLAKSPADRPPTAEVLAHRLESLADVPRWDRSRAREWWNLHRPVDPAKRRLAADTTAVKVVLPQR